MPYAGFQAFILCGPGLSLNTFTSNVADHPKALLPIANRPMVWYPLDWCYRMGVTNITLITPHESAAPLESALAQNPHLTSLPAPKPELLCPASLTQTTGTAEMFRTPEVQKAITSDFIVLPCDLICDLEGSSLLQSWMVLQAGLGGATGGIVDGQSVRMTVGGEKSGRRGGLAVWYPTKGLEGVSQKGDETDMVATTPLPRPAVPAPEGHLQPNIERLVLSIPTSTVKDITEDQKSFPMRHALLRQHGKVKIKTSHRDAHVYFLPFWVKEMIRENQVFDSLSEDVIGWWAKAGWQQGLADKLHLREVLNDAPCTPDADDLMMASSMQLDEEVDLAAMSTSSLSLPTATRSADTFASRVPGNLETDDTSQDALTIPPILAYVQPSFTDAPTQPLIRRVDTSSLLLSISLRLAKMPSIAEATATGVTPSHFAHAAKVAHPDMIQQQTRVSEADSLVAENVTIGSRVNIKESVIGVGCSIGNGARLTRCLLMDGVVVGENVTLTGCIVGKRCRIEGGGAKDEDKTRLTDCEMQPGFVVEWGSEFIVFQLRIGTVLTMLVQPKARMKSSWCSRASVMMMGTRSWLVMMMMMKPCPRTMEKAHLTYKQFTMYGKKNFSGPHSL
jgi:translation initiation factor eIF-2B subunit gamma